MSSKRATPSARPHFTPLFDAIIEDGSLIEAAVFGAVWRLSQGDAGECWASCRTIARIVGVSRSVCERSLGKLEAAGALIRVRYHAGLTVVRKPSQTVLAGSGQPEPSRPRASAPGVPEDWPPDVVPLEILSPTGAERRRKQRAARVGRTDSPPAPSPTDAPEPDHPMPDVRPSDPRLSEPRRTGEGPTSLRGTNTEGKIQGRPAVPAGIQILRSVTRRYPKREIWPALCEILGQEPDKEKLAACYQAWLLRGYNPLNYAWVTNWYREGIPEHSKKGERRYAAPDSGEGFDGKPGVI